MSVILPAIAVSSAMGSVWSGATQEVEVALLPERTAWQAGKPMTFALRFKLEAGWHIYWMNPGDAGMATRIEWRLPPGFKVGPLQWPTPILIDVGGVVSYGFENELVLLATVTPPATLNPSKRYGVSVNAAWLVCKESCVPGSTSASASLPVSKSEPPIHAVGAATIESGRRRLPVQDPRVSGTALVDGNVFRLTVSVPDLASRALWSAYFFPAKEGLVDHSAAQTWSADAGALRLSVPKFSGAPRQVGTLEGCLLVRWNESDQTAYWVSIKFR